MNNLIYDQLIYLLALLRAPGLSPIIFYKLNDLFANLDDIFKLPIKDLKALGISESLMKYLQNPDWKGAEKDLIWLQQSDHSLLTWQDPTYPKLLAEIPARPPILFVKGNRKALTTPQLSIIGSRNPTPAGIHTARQYAEQLASNGLTITSGLALGIDAASHQGALNAGGLTVAVLGTGIDQIYPLRHKKLVEQILDQNGVLVSEFSIGMKALRENFPRRNRIISGLSLGVLVVEAALQSGSLITARYALEQGREIFAIPGSIHNPMAKGCHALIKQGAKLVESTSDIIDELKWLKSIVIEEQKKPSCKKPLDKAYARLVECVGFEVTSVDTIIRLSELTAEKVSAMLTLLEIEGYVTGFSGGYVRNNVIM